MTSYVMRAALLLLLMPAMVSAAALDDYYLAKFGEQAGTVKALVQTATGAAVADRCQMPLYRNLKKDWGKLESATQKVLAKQVSRPLLTSAAVYNSPGGHFTIHYATLGTDAPSLTDADHDGVPDWVERVAEVFDSVYSTEVFTMGYRSPTVGRYDVYLRNLTTQGAYGFTTDDGIPTYPAVSASSYIEIDRAFTDSMFTVNGRFTPLQILEVTAAHEFHHAIQYNYNYYFDVSYAEMTSTWMEDQVYDSVNQLYDYLDNYLSATSTISLNARLDGGSEYGRWIFNRYLAEAHDSALIKNVWTAIAATPAPAGGFDLPMLPVIESTLKGAGGTLAGDFAAFAKRVVLRNWGSHVDETSLIPAVAPHATYSNYPVDLAALRSQITALPLYTFGYYRFLPSQTAPINLILSLPNVPAAVEVVAVRKLTDGTLLEYPLDRNAGTVTVPAFNVVGTAEVVVIISNTTSESATVSVTVPSSGKGGGGCFIATAAYGSYLHPKVALLQEFRDRYLLTNAPGRVFVSAYYQLSPPLARVIAEHAWMRAGVRALLTPLVLVVEYPGAIVFLFAAGGVWFVWRRKGGFSLVLNGKSG